MANWSPLQIKPSHKINSFQTLFTNDQGQHTRTSTLKLPPATKEEMEATAAMVVGTLINQKVLVRADTSSPLKVSTTVTLLSNLASPEKKCMLVNFKKCTE